MSNNPSAAATLITVAPTGAESEKSAVPALPVTLDELVTTAKECQAGGAAVVHVHIRDAEARPTLDLSRLRDTVAALRAGTDLIVQLSTGGLAFLRGGHQLVQGDRERGDGRLLGLGAGGRDRDQGGCGGRVVNHDQSMPTFACSRPSGGGCPVGFRPGASWPPVMPGGATG